MRRRLLLPLFSASYKDFKGISSEDSHELQTEFIRKYRNKSRLPGRDTYSCVAAFSCSYLMSH